ncbi:hypothetical protein [Sphingomonas pokkalii]|uniref:Uncharacterized protein n=1 Tax=Sphingomonas pokkalii TaxID=2175090 RepID=A0A2U0SDD1_9SPHN|nr:hypothetical protein [Sphingomonas pokkalii]PVX29392.1 hypothetical protein DD559_08745 [Sphingomonas pokkalii]
MPNITNDRDDPRSDIQQAVETRSDTADTAAKEGAPRPKAVPLGAGGENGADGIVKNQEFGQD